MAAVFAARKILSRIFISRSTASRMSQTPRAVLSGLSGGSALAGSMARFAALYSSPTKALPPDTKLL